MHDLYVTTLIASPFLFLLLLYAVLPMSGERMPDGNADAGDTTTAEWDEWLARIIAEDDPANGGDDVLRIGDCAKCDGFGVVEYVGKWHATPHLVTCPRCAGTRDAH